MATNQSTATDLVEVVYQEDLTKKGLADLRKKYPKSFSLDMSDDEQFKQARAIRAEFNKLVKSINERRIGFSKELKTYGDDLVKKVEAIYAPTVEAFLLEDKHRKEEAARIAKEREQFLNKQRDEIAQMSNFVDQCKNQGSQFIADTIEAVDLVDTESFDKELIHEAIDTKKGILETLNNMYQAVKAAEAVEAEREQLRIQQEAIAQQERLQKQAQEIDARINNLRADPMNYFDKSSAEIAKRIEKLDTFTPTNEKFGDRLDEVIQVLAQVIQQLKMMHQQKLQLESIAVTTDPEPQVQVNQEPIEQSTPIEQQEHEALTEVNRMLDQNEQPLLGNSFKSTMFENTSAPINYMPLSAWPSSQDRADNDELDRICDQLDLAESYIEVLEQRLNKAHAA
ncbi:hypothetical protein I6F43_07815 [Pseudoalteromonas sp. NZS71_1]|uniref:hypothetical protein n=1 Tax=Pseudoalteromonas sp. NZS71_1 TaxID=2792072 RepID=UPI0018CD2E99|nr:hypothetical protein [Pseudoalteromonas sp. NZS71_1]MBH0034586.1 hypothetical protein [Pseudoalteromonas sp. NZS71_1]